MKRWTLMIVAVVSALALIATPALAMDRTRSQDRSQDQLQAGSCTDCAAECDQLQLCTSDQIQLRTQECDLTQPVATEQVQSMTQAGEEVQAQTKTAAQLQTMTQTNTEVGEPVHAQTQTRAGEPVQAQSKTAIQLHTQAQAHASEWAEKIARHQNQHAKKYAKCVKIIASSD